VRLVPFFLGGDDKEWWVQGQLNPLCELFVFGFICIHIVTYRNIRLVQIYTSIIQSLWTSKLGGRVRKKD